MSDDDLTPEGLRHDGLTRDDLRLLERREATGLLLTRGATNYRRDVQAIVGWPPGAMYHARWPTDGVMGEPEPDVLKGTWVLFGLDSPDGVVALRFARVMKVRTVWGVDDPETMAACFQLKLLLGPWPATVFDRMSGPRLDTPDAPVGTKYDGPAKIRKAISDQLAPDRVRSWIAVERLGPFYADYSPESWSAVAAAVIQIPGHRRTPLLTMTSFRPDDGDDRRYRVPYWYEDLGLVPPRDSSRRQRFPRQTGGYYAVRSSTPYTIRAMLCAPRSGELHPLELKTTDRLITPLAPPQVPQRTTFELVDLPFVASAVRRRRTMLTIGLAERPRSRTTLAPLEIAVPLRVAPPLAVQVVQWFALAAVAASVVALAVFKGDPKIWVAVLTAAGAAGLATLSRGDA